MLQGVVSVQRPKGVGQVIVMLFSVPDNDFHLLKAVRDTYQAYRNDFAEQNGLTSTNQPDKTFTWLDFCKKIPRQYQADRNFSLICYRTYQDTTVKTCGDPILSTQGITYFTKDQYIT